MMCGDGGKGGECPLILPSLGRPALNRFSQLGDACLRRGPPNRHSGPQKASGLGRLGRRVRARGRFSRGGRRGIGEGRSEGRRRGRGRRACGCCRARRGLRGRGEGRQRGGRTVRKRRWTCGRDWRPGSLGGRSARWGVSRQSVARRCPTDRDQTGAVARECCKDDPDQEGVQSLAGRQRAECMAHGVCRGMITGLCACGKRTHPGRGDGL